MDTKAKLIVDLGDRGEKLLKSQLGAEEEVKVKLKGMYGEAFVVTNKRIYIPKWGYMAGSLFGGRCNAFEYRNIISIEIRKGIMTGHLEILTGATQNAYKTGIWAGETTKKDNMVAITNYQFAAFQEGVNIARNMISELMSLPTTSKKDDVAAQIEKFSKLKDKGIITEEEFNAKKKQLLGL